MSEQLQTQELTNWLVGPYTNGATEQLQQWEYPFHHTALQALRNLTGSNNVDVSTIGPQQGAELYRTLSRQRRMRRMIGGLQLYTSSPPDDAVVNHFFDDQHEIIESFANNFDENFNPEEPLNIKSPTGTGKTVVMVGLAEALKHNESPAEETGVLVLVPRKEILDQTMRAFERFSKGIRPSKYFGEHKQVTKTTVMTYQSFNKAYEEGVIHRDDFDAVIKDESHFSHGKKTKKSLQEFTMGANQDDPMLVFELSATPKVKAPEDLIYEKTVVESVAEGRLSPVAARRISTASHINELENYEERSDFLLQEVAGLIDDEERNEIIVDEILKGLASGKRTIVRCLPGDNLRHTQVIQDMLRKRGRVKIVDPHVMRTEQRKINSFIIRGDMSLALRRNVTKTFTENYNFDLDVLLFVDTITQGWDSLIAKKVINTAPTRSPIVIEQLFGRVLRQYTNLRGKTVTGEAVDLIDDSMSGQISFTDILDRDAPEGMRYREGVTIGPNLCDYNNPELGANSAFIPLYSRPFEACIRLC